jgi:seryl-tRNA(Sec) selenium transferase
MIAGVDLDTARNLCGVIGDEHGGRSPLASANSNGAWSAAASAAALPGREDHAGGIDRRTGDQVHRATAVAAARVAVAAVGAVLAGAAAAQLADRTHRRSGLPPATPP